MVAVCFFNFTQFVILENLSIFDLALSGVKGIITIPKDIIEVDTYLCCVPTLSLTGSAVICHRWCSLECLYGVE